MARERMVTRTIDTTVVTYMVLDLTSLKVTADSVTLTGVFDNDDKLLSRIKKMCDTDTVKVAHITAVTYSEVLYGMSELDFIKYASVLPPR